MQPKKERERFAANFSGGVEMFHEAPSDWMKDDKVPRDYVLEAIVRKFRARGETSKIQWIRRAWASKTDSFEIPEVRAAWDAAGLRMPAAVLDFDEDGEYVFKPVARFPTDDDKLCQLLRQL